MRWRPTHTLLLVALMVSIGVNVMLRRDPTRPNREFLPDMVRTARQNAFEPSNAFADRTTLRTPPAGTIPRGVSLLDYGTSVTEAMRAGRELTNPVPDDAAAVERGGRLFEDFCLTCHGAQGRGDGPVTIRGVRRPPSLLRPSTIRMADGQMFHVITYGQRTMASYAAQLVEEDRWRVVRYVRTLQATQGAADDREEP